MPAKHAKQREIIRANALQRTPSEALEAELLRRAIARADEAIVRMQTALVAMWKKQVARKWELRKKEGEKHS